MLKWCIIKSKTIYILFYKFMICVTIFFVFVKKLRKKFKFIKFSFIKYVSVLNRKSCVLGGSLRCIDCVL